MDVANPASMMLSCAMFHALLDALDDEEAMAPFHPDIAPMPPEIRTALAPTGVLRAAVNMSNFLLVSERTPDGGPAGVSPDMAAAIAECLGLEIQYLPYPNPGALADRAGADEWDIALIGAEPQRAESISFTSAYSEIEATYLVAAGSAIQRVEEVDVNGRRIAVAERTAYCLWLDRNIRRAEVVHAQGVDASFELFAAGGFDALAGLRARLISDVENLPGSRLLEGRFMTVQQAIGVPKAKHIVAAWLETFVQAARDQGFVAELIEKFGVKGLSVASGS
ncbi:MAG: transporter substrate-binding protein [Hyphomicrobiales bacterium]|nr:transporter substrate-binding protein [Hyphomicrobiales bacterium]